MVYADQYHPIPEQGRSVPPETPSVAVERLLSRLSGRQRRQSRRQISFVEVQPGQPGSFESLSPVSSSPRPVIQRGALTCHANFQFDTSDRHDEYPPSIRCRQGNNLTECLEGLGHSLGLPSHVGAMPTRVATC